MISGYTHNAYYDSTGRLAYKTTTDTNSTSGDKLKYSLGYSYDVNNNVTKYTYSDKNISNTQQYTYTTDNLLESHILPSGKTNTYTYDGLGRLTGKSIVFGENNTMEKAYTYYTTTRGVENGTTYATTKLETESFGDTGYKYFYDTSGNITEIHKGTKIEGNFAYVLDVRYTYDNMNQLTQVDDFGNLTKYTYRYDTAGNITRKCKYAMVSTSNWVVSETLENIQYHYLDATWGDLLSAYDGDAITYDEIGNPLNYRDGITMTWQNGRQLATLNNGTSSIAYTYDANGMRTGKTVTTGGTSVEWEYTYEGGQLLQMKRGNRILDFSYDVNGTPVGFSYRSRETATPTYYYYQLNSRGDVIGLYNSSGVLTYIYEYDAYGNILSVTNSSGIEMTSETNIAILNPLRYRGYVYDNETGLYYLQSRYYDPTTCRFINADGLVSTGIGTLGYNMFAYCNNNPVLYLDSEGSRPVVGDDNGDESGAFDYMNKLATKEEYVETSNDTIDIVNYVNKGHLTSPTAMLDLGTLWGKVGFSQTITEESVSPGVFHAYSDIGNDSTEYGAGINLWDWVGLSIGLSDDLNLSANLQVTPWAHLETSIGTSGVGIKLGGISGSLTSDFELNVGIGPAVIVASFIFGVPYLSPQTAYSY